MELANVDAAVALVEYYAKTPAVVRERTVYPQYSSYKELKESSKKEAKVNRVLLVTVRNPRYPINVDVFNTIFSPFGELVRMVIFEKEAGLQGLVQFRDAAAATMALTALQ